MNIKSSKNISKIIIYIILLVVLIITVYPVIWMILGSLKSTSEFYINIWGIPSEPQWENYANAWNMAGIGQKYINSVFVLLLFLVITIPVNNCAAYVLARLDFKGKKAIYTYLLTGLMIPGAVLAIPIFTVVLRLGLVNSLWGLVLVYAAQAISFVYFKGFLYILAKEP